MNLSSPRRGHHRKRLSALRLSSDSTVTTLPLYTSPTWQGVPELSEDASDQPPDYPDSAEEADADTDTDESNAVYISPPPSLPVSPRRVLPRRSQTPRIYRRKSSTASDPYLDSLLERSVHALEMSNALLQSSMSTQSSLSAVLASNSAADRSLEARAQLLSSRIIGSGGVHNSWIHDLDEISRGVEGLVGVSGLEEGGLETDIPQTEISVSRSLPTSGLTERIQRRHSRRPSFDLHQSASSQLQYSNHDRSHFVAPAPRALTMYIDSTDDPDLISLPSTLGVRVASALPPTPLPSETFSIINSSEAVPTGSMEQTRRAADMLSSYVIRESARSSPPSSFKSSRTATQSRRSSSTATPRKSKSPPPHIIVDQPSSSTTIRSRSLTPLRASSPPRIPRPMTPPIEELSTSSDSSTSETLHVDRTVESLRQILERQKCASCSNHQDKSRSTSCASDKRTIPLPAFLSPPPVAPISGTSTATASVSRLFSKPRHSSSTRPPSPPRHSSLKNRSAPPTPLSATPSSSFLHVPDAFRVVRAASVGSQTSSGRSTPKRISFAELPESYASSKPDGAGSKFKGKNNKGKGRATDGRRTREGDAQREEGAGWWTGWLMGAAGTGNGTGLSLGAARQRAEERSPKSPTWSARPGFGSSLEDWGV